LLHYGFEERPAQHPGREGEEVQGRRPPGREIDQGQPLPDRRPQLRGRGLSHRRPGQQAEVYLQLVTPARSGRLYRGSQNEDLSEVPQVPEVR